MKLFNDSYSIKPHISLIRARNRGDETYLDGYVWTEFGAVGVYSQGSDKSVRASHLQFAYKGRVYVRRFNKRFSERGLVTKAKEFAKEISEAL